MNSLPESLDPEEKATYRFEKSKLKDKDPDIIISETDSIYNSYWENYLWSIISELNYFTFGMERKSKNVVILNKILKAHKSKTLD